jgi:hypothetical protein
MEAEACGCWLLCRGRGRTKVLARMRLKTTLLAFGLASMLAGLVADAETTFCVATNGNDANPGTRGRPFRTLERAREAVRSAGPRRARQVVVRGGTYEFSASFALGPQDSGTAKHPVIWEVAKGETVRLEGGRKLPASAWQPVEDSATLQRLDPAARGKVRKADLKALGISTPPFPISYHGAPPGPELFCDDQRMRLACWPNQGWATIARIVEPGSRPRDGDSAGKTGIFEYSGERPGKWQAADGVWLQGYWCYDWYDEVIRVAAVDPATHRITLAAPHVYSLMQGNPSPRRYRALNVLEELDQPGEFVVNASSGIIYFCPPDNGAAPVIISTLDAPVVALRGASHIQLRGFTVECGLGDGIELTGGTNCFIQACTVRNLRHSGIRVEGGFAHRVCDCDIHDTGTGGLSIAGGDRKTLTPGRHEALNNHIWRFSQHQLTSAYGLSFGGVGCRAAHNLIHDAPHQAVFVGGNDHVFELNEVHHVCTETDDCGALYKGRNPSCRGNVIRFNYWHDIGSPMGHGNAAIYFDDGDGGDLVQGNVFVRCGDPGRGSFGTVFSHGGHDIRAENNIFVDCKRALGSAPWDDARWRDALKGGQDCFFPDKLLKEVDITKPPYVTHYPELVNYMDPPPGAKRVSWAKLNVFVRCKQLSSGNWQLEPGPNWSTDHDPGFVNMDKVDYRLRRNAEAFKQLKDFTPIPCDQIGLQKR